MVGSSEPVRAPLEVVVALLADSQGRWLLNRRPPGRPLAGFWEFPGGKREPTEDAWAALCRELAEELGIEVEAGHRFLELRHEYTDRSVRLDVWRVSRYRGRPQARERQLLRWLALEEIDGIPLLEADWPIIAALRVAARSTERE
jgi:8-oxo-dGTP diphosphatase